MWKLGFKLKDYLYGDEVSLVSNEVFLDILFNRIFAALWMLLVEVVDELLLRLDRPVDHSYELWEFQIYGIGVISFLNVFIVAFTKCSLFGFRFVDWEVCA